MKKALLAFVIFSALYLIGCDENSTNNPVSSQSVDKLVHQDSKILRGSIPLDRILILPGGFNTYYHLSGRINYKEEIFDLKPDLTDLKYNVDVGILFDATLTNTRAYANDINGLIIHSESENKFNLSRDGKAYVFEKSYSVQRSTDSLRLICKFSATYDGLELDSIKFATKGSR